MFRPLGINIGLRYGFSKRSFIAYVSSLAVFGLALSTAVLLLVLSVVNGFERELRERVLGVIPHVTLRGRGPVTEDDEALASLRALPGVEGAASYLSAPALLAGVNQVRGAALTGIRPAAFDAISSIGSFTDRAAFEKLGEPGFPVLLGSGLAAELNVGVGDFVTVIMPEGSVSPIGLHPRQRRFVVVGLLHTSSELDASAAYTSIAAAARLFRTGGGVHGYQLRLDDLFAAERVGRAALTVLGGDFFGTTWMRTHGNLYRAIGLQKLTMFVLLSFLVGVAAFNLISTLVMVVNERRSDIAVLRTLGTSTAVLATAFVTLGLTIGLLGIGLGIAGGVLLGVLLENGFSFISEVLDLNLLNQYFVTYLPVETRFTDVVAVAATALILCLLSSLYPAWRAARLPPTRILKYE